MEKAQLLITIIDDAAGIVDSPRSRTKLFEALEKVFQEKGIVVSIDVNESTREEGPSSEPGLP